MTNWKRQSPVIGGILVAVLTILSAPLWNEPAIPGNPASGGNLLVNGVAGIFMGLVAMIVLWVAGKLR